MPYGENCSIGSRSKWFDLSIQCIEGKVDAKDTFHTRPPVIAAHGCYRLLDIQRMHSALASDGAC